MAFTVRAFGHRGLSQLPALLPRQFASDAIYQLVQPYDWRDTVLTNGLTPVTLDAPADSPGITTMAVRIEVPDAEAIRYEINPPTRQGGIVLAGPNSPLLAGINIFYFRGGWSISLIDAAGT